MKENEILTKIIDELEKPERVRIDYEIWVKHKEHLEREATLRGRLIFDSEEYSGMEVLTPEEVRCVRMAVNKIMPQEFMMDKRVNERFKAEFLKEFPEREQDFGYGAFKLTPQEVIWRLKYQMGSMRAHIHKGVSQCDSEG